MAHGPLGHSYRDQALAQVIDLIGETNYLLQAVNTEAKDRDKIPKPDPWPRPYESAQPNSE